VHAAGGGDGGRDQIAALFVDNEPAEDGVSESARKDDENGPPDDLRRAVPGGSGDRI
jgi:hypothetical protein